MNTHIMHCMLCCAIVRRVNIWGIEVIFVTLLLMLAKHYFLTFQILVDKIKTKITAESHLNILKQPHG